MKNNGKSSSENLDVYKVRQSLEYLYQIYSDMSFNADEISKKRCPYKNAQSRCTANFDCKNQFFPEKEQDSPICTGSDLLDYRPAWQV